jgi:ribosome-associated translation inhibitor RaiA
MNLSEPKTLLSAEGFSARPELVAHVEVKATKLRRHETFQIGHVRLHVRHERPHNGTMRFTVSATAETRGADFVAHSSAGLPESAINSAFDKLERAVAEAAGEWKHNQRHPRAIEMPMALPKAI